MQPRAHRKLPAPLARWYLAVLLLAPELEAQEPAEAITVTSVYTAELWRNTRGGLATGSVYLDNVQIAVELDAERSWGWPGATLLLEGLYNNGNSLSSTLVGDLQTVSNIESASNEARIYQALLETPLGQRGSVRLGLYDLNSEFDVLESANLFLQSAHGIGTDLGQTGRNGPSIFPLTSLGVRVAWEWGAGWGARAVALDGAPGDRDDPTEMDVDLGDGDGALLVAELERETLDATLLLGAWRYTAEFPTWQTRAAGEADLDRGNHGAYLRGEWRPTDALAVFGRAGVARARHNVFDRFFGGGLHWRGPLAGRAGDVVGVAVAWTETSAEYRAARRLEGQQPRPREVSVELTWRLPVTEWLVLQPDLQYVRHPGVNPALDDAWVAGLRMELTLL